MRRAGMVVAALLLPGCPTPTSDVAGTAPAQRDIVDPDAIDVYQRSTLPGHPECDDGRCVEIMFRDPVCAGSFGPEDFTVEVTDFASAQLHHLCGSEFFDKMVFANSSGRSFADRAAVATHRALCETAEVAIDDFRDTVALHISDEAWARYFAGHDYSLGKIRIQVFVGDSDGQSVCPEPWSAALLDENLSVEPIDPSCQPTPLGGCDATVVVTVDERPVTAGLAVQFDVDREDLSVPAPSVGLTTLQPEGPGSGLLRRGYCPSTVCGGLLGWPTSYFPPHGVMQADFRARDGLARFGVLVEHAAGTYTSVEDVNASSLPIRLLGSTGSDFDPSVDETLFVRPASGADVWGTGANLRNFEVTTDRTLLDVGTPLRLQLPPVTQSTHGRTLTRRPGALVGPLTTSLVRFSAPRYSSISGTAVRVQGLVDPRVVVDHVTLRTRKFGLSVDVRPSFAGAFSYTMTWNTVDDVEDMLEAEAFDAAGRSLGYDLVPLMIVGSASDPDGDGIPTGEDKCDGVYDPMQIDLNDGTPGAYLCEPGTDTDGDGLAKEEERTAGTSSALSDTDGDGVPDGDEVDAYARTPFEGMLDPTSDDSDGDGESDATEMRRRDPNGDGIPDVIDPLNGTVGLDPADTLFLVEETWDTQFAANLAGLTDSPDVNVAATVQFTLNYVLVVRGGNWLSGDTPLPTGHLGTDASVLGRVVRLDSFGLPFMTDVRVETTRCTSTGGAIAQECDFVPVIGSCDGTTGTGDDDDFCWETYRTLRPEGVHRDRSAFVIDDYPLAGFDRAAGGQIIGPVRFGMGPISRSFGGAAYYGGIAPDGRDDRRSNPGLYLNVASLHLDGERTARSVEGLSLLLCRRSEGGTAATTSAGENGRCDPVSVEGNLQMHAEGGIFLDFFGGLTSRDGVVPASYGLCNDDLIDLIRGNTTEVSDYQRHGDSSRRSSGPCGQTIISRNSPGPNLGGAPLSIIDRRIDYVVRRLGLQFEDGPARDASMDYRIPSGHACPV